MALDYNYPFSSPTGQEFTDTITAALGTAIVDFTPISGIKGDAVQLYQGGVMSSSSNQTTLTLSGGIFVATDVGKLIVVRGAGAAGVDLSTTIAGYTSATTVTLSAPAQTTVANAGVRYGSDDTAGWQAVLDAIESGRRASQAADLHARAAIPGGYIVGKSSMISAPLTFGRYVDLRAPQCRLFTTGFNDYTLKGSVSGSGYLLHIEGLSIIDAVSGIYIDNASLDAGRVELERCDFAALTDTAIRLKCQSSHVQIRDCHWLSCETILYNESGDEVKIYGGWMTERPRSVTSAKESIINYGHLTMYDTCLVPRAPVSGFYESAWIANYYNPTLVAGGGRSGVVELRGVRGGGELGSKSLVNNYAPGQVGNTSHTVVSIRDGMANAQNTGTAEAATNEQRGVVRLFDVPNYLVVEGLTQIATPAVCIGMSGGSPTDLAAKIAAFGVDHFRMRIDNHRYGVTGTYGNTSNMFPIALVSGLSPQVRQLATGATLKPDDFDRTITNVGATATTFYALPAAKQGFPIRFRRVATQIMTIQTAQSATPDTMTASTLVSNGANSYRYIQLTVDGQDVDFTCLADGAWTVSKRTDWS